MRRRNMSLTLTLSAENDVPSSEGSSTPPKTSGIRHVAELVRPPEVCEVCAEQWPEADLCRACAEAYRRFQISLLVVSSELRRK